MKLSIIGSGKVGAAIGYTAMLKGLVTDIVMVDAFKEKAQGEALDMLHCQPFAPQARLRSGDIAATAGSDIVVVTAGIPRKADEPRVLLLSRNASLVGDLVREAVKLSPQAIILMVTNPLDVMTHLAYKVSGLPKERVLGLGTVLDTARYRGYLADAFNIDAHDLDAYVVGEHGETMVPLTSNITVRGLSLSAIPGFTAEKLSSIVTDVIEASSTVIALKGGTVFAPALSACAVIEAIVRDSRTVLPVCTYNEQYGVAVSLPTMVGRSGATAVLEISMSDCEQSALAASVENIKAYVAELDKVMSTK